MKIVLAFVFAIAATTAFAIADPTSVDHGGAYVGSVVVEPGQVVEGDVNVVLGDATIEGTVDGDVNVLGGNVIFRNGGHITGVPHAIGGEVVQDIVPWAPTADTSNRAEHHLWWRVASAIIVLVVFLMFPLRTRMALDRLEQHPAIATLAGVCGWVAVIPVAIVLFITFILWPLIPVEFVLLLVATVIGQAALALLVGRRFYELIAPKTTPTPLVALVIGLILLTAAELVPILGIMVILLTMLVGLGAVLLTFVPDWSVPGTPGSPPRNVIGGPPMPVG